MPFAEPTAPVTPPEGEPAAGLTPDARYAPDHTLELPMRLLGRTVKRTGDALLALRPGQVLAVHTDDP